MTMPSASASSVLQVRDSELYVSQLFRSPLALDILADDLERGSTTGRSEVGGRPEVVFVGTHLILS